MKRRKRRQEPLNIFLKTGFDSFSKTIEIQSDQIKASYRREIDWSQSIGIGILFGFLSVIFEMGL